MQWHASVCCQREEVLVRLVCQLEKVLAVRPSPRSIVDAWQVRRVSHSIRHLEAECLLGWIFIKELTIKWVPVIVIFAISYLPAVVPPRISCI